MLKLMIKKGFTLLDVMIALSIFSVAVFSALNIHLLKVRQEGANHKLEQYIDCIEVAAKGIVGKNKYADLKSFSTGGSWYINENNISFDILAASNITPLMNHSIPSGSNYLKITLTGDDVLIIKLELKYIINERIETITYEVYKGTYN